MQDDTQLLFNISQKGVLRPEKIRWMYDMSSPSILESIRSASLRKVFSKSDTYLKKYNVVVIKKEMGESEYQEWHRHYVTVMHLKQYAVIATPTWFQEKVIEGKKVYGLFFTEDNELVGSLIYIEQDGCITSAFKTSHGMDGPKKKHHYLGSLIDYVFLYTAQLHHPKKITLGSMRNAFGVYNTIGNLEQKIAMGFYPVAKEKTYILHDVPQSKNGGVFFYGLKDSQLMPCFAHQLGTPLWLELAHLFHDKIYDIEL